MRQFAPAWENSAVEEPYRTVGVVEAADRPAPTPPAMRPWTRARYWVDRGLSFGPLLASLPAFALASVLADSALVVGGVLAVGGCVLAGRRSPRRDAWAKLNAEAAALLDAGESEKAERILRGLVESTRAYPRDQAVFLLNLGSSLVWRDVDRALAILLVIESSGWLAPREARALLHAEIACCRALRGERERAAEALETARALGDVPILVEALVACRTGRYEDAVEDVWSRTEAIASMKPHAKALLRLLAAFALERLGRPQTIEVTRLLEGAEAYSGAHVRTLTDRWLDLAEFARRHGLLDDVDGPRDNVAAHGSAEGSA